MKFPWVSRKQYDRVFAALRMVNDQVIQLKLDNKNLTEERDRILYNASRLADIEREDRKLEQSHFEAVLNNIQERSKP